MTDARATTLRTLFEILAVLAGVVVLIKFALPQLWGIWEGANLLGGLADTALLVVLAGPLVFWRLRVANLRAAAWLARSGAAPMAGLLPWAVLAVGVGTSIALSARLNGSRREITEAQFERRAEGVVSRVEPTMLIPRHGLRGMAGLFKASKSVERAEFADYVGARSLQTEFPGVIGFGYVERLTARAAVENDLRRAIGAEQFVLEYQPIVSLETHRVAGFEALIRWEHPEHGRIRPDEFIPAAERTGLILPIGAWVLETACRQFMVWRAELGSFAPDHISVNLSRIQLVQPDLPEVIAEILRRTGVPPECLHLEITESAVMEDIASGTRMLHAIGALGVRQSLDDFGTGHSSLATLHDFPVQVLKIDRAFIANIDRGRRFLALIHAAADLASNLGMEVVAEGVETAGQVAVLQSLGCEFGQGYHFARPLPAAEVAAFLRSWSGGGGRARAA